MKITYIHYHLKPGGVTTVLKHQSDAVRNFGKPLLLCGEPPQEEWQDNVEIIPGIAYDSIHNDSDSPEQISKSILASIHSKWPEGCDLIHIHNPTLAKNKSFLKVIRALQQSKIPLLLQVHDFAEDGRPHAYFPDSYPENCHWCVINQRDYGAMIQAGGKEKGVHYLPNAVVINKGSIPDKQPDECVLYPVRAIRRKNIGEALLLSLYLKNTLPVRVTLPPNSPVDIKSYKSWKQFSSTHRFNIEFEAGLTHDFLSLVNSARWVMSCSIMEGFGFSFLESWLLGKAVWGRYLNGICDGFEQEGIKFPHFYNSIDVPLNWIGEREFAESWLKTINSAYKAYGIPPNNDDICRSLEEIKERSAIDFGMLNEHFQKKVLRRILDNKFDYNALAKKNPVLLYIPDIVSTKSLVEPNALIIEKKFSLNNYEQLLKEIYKKVIKTNVEQKINKETLLNEFLTPQLFSLLKWGDYAE